MMKRPEAGDRVIMRYRFSSGHELVEFRIVQIRDGLVHLECKASSGWTFHAQCAEGELDPQLFGGWIHRDAQPTEAPKWKVQIPE